MSLPCVRGGAARSAAEGLYLTNYLLFFLQTSHLYNPSGAVAPAPFAQGSLWVCANIAKTFCFCRVRVCPRICPVVRLITAIPAPSALSSPTTCPTRNKKFLSGLDKVISIRYNRYVRRRSLVVKPQLPKLEMRVRFPSPAPKKQCRPIAGCT